MDGGRRRSRCQAAAASEITIRSLSLLPITPVTSCALGDHTALISLIKSSSLFLQAFFLLLTSVNSCLLVVNNWCNDLVSGILEKALNPRANLKQQSWSGVATKPGHFFTGSVNTHKLERKCLSPSLKPTRTECFYLRKNSQGLQRTCRVFRFHAALRSNAYCKKRADVLLLLSWFLHSVALQKGWNCFSLSNEFLYPYIRTRNLPPRRSYPSPCNLTDTDSSPGRLWD